MSDSNPFVTQLKALAAAAQEDPPYSYRSRIIGQFVLCGILAVLSTAWIILTILDFRIRGKKIKLVRLQRVNGGRILVFDCMFVFVILAALSGVVLIAGRYNAFAHYYVENGDSIRNQLICNFASQLPMGTSATIFSFSNLAGSIAIRRQQKGLISFTAPLVWAYNISLTFTISLLFIMLALTGVANERLNRVMYIREAAYATLVKAAQTFEHNPQDPWLAEAVKALGLLKVEGAEGLRIFKHWFGTIVILACVQMLILIAACLASLSFVLLLRKQSHGKARSMGETIRTFHAQTRISAASEDYNLDQRPPEPGSNMSKVSARRYVTDNNTVAEADRAEGAALARLASNLTVSVPCIVILSVHVCVYVTFIYYNIERRDWRTQEYLKDGWSWTDLMINNTLLACFLYNHLCGTGATARHHSSGMASASFAGSKGNWSSHVGHWHTPIAQDGKSAPNLEIAVHVELEHQVDDKNDGRHTDWEMGTVPYKQ